jgi:hypothetical protein
MENIRLLTNKDKCEFPDDDCTLIATSIVYDRIHSKVILCCDGHAERVVEADYPEYTDYCQNCGCRQGVN